MMVSQQWVAIKRSREWVCAGIPSEVRTFHESLDGYAATPLIDLPELARELGVARIVVKDESFRLGLPAFKALGASYAIHRALHGISAPQMLVTATDGNHGRAVARFARVLGHSARIVIPSGVHPTAVQAIRDEGADVFVQGGSYDDAVAEAARIAADEGGVLIQDTAWPGYEEVPAWIVQGYATLFAEIDDQLGGVAPSLVIVPVGVGSLAQAAVEHYRSHVSSTALVSVEPTVAACVLASLDAGEAVSVETQDTVMSGLNCGTVSALAWPLLRQGLDGAVAVTDEESIASAGVLAASGVDSGPCGAATVAAARRVLTGPEIRAHLGLDASSVVVLLSTEGSAANPGATSA